MTVLQKERNEHVDKNTLKDISTDALKVYLQRELATNNIGKIDTPPHFPAERRNGEHVGHVSRYPQKFQLYLHEVNVRLGEAFRNIDINSQDIDQDILYFDGRKNIGKTCVAVYEKAVKSLTDNELIVLGYIACVDSQAFGSLADQLKAHMENISMKSTFSKVHGQERITRCPFQGISRTILNFARKRRLVLMSSKEQSVVAEGVSTYFSDVIEIECRKRGWGEYFIDLQRLLI